MRSLNGSKAENWKKQSLHSCCINKCDAKNIRFIIAFWLTDALRSSKMCGLIFGGVPEWSKGADCKSAGSTFGGSNPPPSTISMNRCWQDKLWLAAGRLSQMGRVWTDRGSTKIAGSNFERRVFCGGPKGERQDAWSNPPPSTISLKMGSFTDCSAGVVQW